MYRHLLFPALLFGSALSADAQSNSFPSSGFVGIGTTSPQQRLHVEGSSNQAIFVNTSALSNTSGSGQIGYTKHLPTAAGNRLGYFLVGSRGGAQFNYNVAGMVGYAASAWSAGSSHPAYLAFETTPSGSVSRQERVRIAADGNVGIGTTTPNNKLEVFSNTFNTINAQNTFLGTSDNIAVNGRSVNQAGWGYGVVGVGGFRGVAGHGDGMDYPEGVIGVLGTAGGSAGSRYGIYGTASGGVFNAAGYFDGDVYSNGVLLTSDRKFKTDIKPMENSLEQLMKLKPATYKFKTSQYAKMNLSKEQQMGLIADEVKQVFPELVSKAVRPAEYDNGNRSKVLVPEEKYEAVNYMGFIPVLIASVQEQKRTIDQQQQQITEQQQQIAELKHLVSTLANTQLSNTTTKGALLQNQPNPVTGSTTIRYSLPNGATRAYLLLTDALGRTVKSISVNSSGVVNLDTSMLSSGVYNYSLVVNDRTIQTKKLTVVK